MDYLFLGFLGWIFVCSPALIYANVVNRRRRADADEFSAKLTNLARQMDGLERRLQSLTKVDAPLPASQKKAPQHAPDVIIPMREPERPATKPAPIAPPTPEQQPVAAAQYPVTPKAPLPPSTAVPVPPRPVEVGGIPMTPSTPSTLTPAVQSPASSASKVAEESLAGSKPKPAAPPEVHASARVEAPPPPALRSTPPVSAHLSDNPKPSFSQPIVSAPAVPQAAVSKKQKSLSIEEALGTNWLPKLGITILVIGVGFLVGSSWANFAPWLRVFLLYSAAFSALLGGILLERRDQQKVLGRALIGGAWAVVFLITYGISHAQSLLLLHSDPVDLALLLAVAGAMVWHTLKYNSQLVTGAAFLLGFTAVALNPDPPYNLLAGAILVTGMTVIVLRRKWFELEVFGILASYLNHCYWLYTVFAEHGHRPFPGFNASLALTVGYWIVFRVSYLVRKIDHDEQEKISTLAGLLNPILLLALMKIQSFHPELAVYALLALGAIEFTLGQLPMSRKRVAPFRLLSSLGATLMIAAVPFKYSGNSLELLWLAVAEAFLLAGIFTRERLFRGFGLIVSFLVAFHTLVFRSEALMREVVNAQAHFHLQLGVVLIAIAMVMYFNAHVTRWLWPKLFSDDMERQATSVLSFLGSFFAVCAIVSLCSDTIIAVVLAALFTLLSWIGQKLEISELVFQSHWIAMVAVAQVCLEGGNEAREWHRIPNRALMFAPVAALLYLSSRFVRLSNTRYNSISATLYALAATASLTLFIWLQMPPWSVVLLWLALALAICAAAQKLRRSDLVWHPFGLVLISATRALFVNFSLISTTHHLSYRLITVSLTAVGIYLLARWAALEELRPVNSVLGTFLLALLAYYEAPVAWTAVAWVSLALLLSLAARLWKDRVLLWQTHFLSALAAGWVLYANFAPQYRGGRVQLLSVGITSILLYVLTWLTNIASVVESERICQPYSWAASLLMSWLAWYQLAPLNISLAWGIFGLLLFEIHDLLRFGATLYRRNLRAQSYVALVCSFAHLFYSNFNERITGPLLQVIVDPRVLTAIALAPIFFWVYSRLHAGSGPVAAESFKTMAAGQ
jgi:hypothetical protein